MEVLNRSNTHLQTFTRGDLHFQCSSNLQVRPMSIGDSWDDDAISPDDIKDIKQPLHVLTSLTHTGGIRPHCCFFTPPL